MAGMQSVVGAIHELPRRGPCGLNPCSKQARVDSSVPIGRGKSGDGVRFGINLERGPRRPGFWEGSPIAVVKGIR